MTRILLILTLLAAPFTFAQEPPRSPTDTVKALQLPPGFTATLFAGEPDIVQPISFCFDDRGRLWVAEGLSYPHWNAQGHDRIVILEDTDGDGQFDKRTLFYDQLNYVTGLEVGFGGVYVVSAPNLLFIPDKNADDKPDGAPEILLEGFGHQGVHNIVNGCTWGPDGWLYGGHGGSSSGYIGAPGSPFAQKIFFDGGVWRYHPTKKIFEPIMEGTTNPWGLDFDDYGQGFIPNSVTPHLYQVIQGAHVQRRRQSPNSRYAYSVIDTIADHKHYVGNDWTKSRTGANEFGGGHAHCGIMCYLGDSWPQQYRNTLFMNNIHGDRINNDLPERKGSGYVAHHGHDFLISADPWYEGLLIKYGPDGAVYVADWYDIGECHTTHPHTQNGRIYKITYQNTPKVPPFDLTKQTSAQLVDLQLHKNDWWVRRARRILQERGPDPAVHAALLKMLHENPDLTRRLRALWALHDTGGATQDLLRTLLHDPSEYLRTWAIQLLTEDRRPSAEVLTDFTHLAADDPSPMVRLYLASAMTRIPPANRWDVLQKLVSHEQDVSDQNLPLMYWYALEPMVVADGKRALALAIDSKIPKLREFVSRRLAETTRKETQN